MICTAIDKSRARAGQFPAAYESAGTLSRPVQAVNPVRNDNY